MTIGFYQEICENKVPLTNIVWVMTKKRISAGETLKLARENKKLTIDDISEQTKVSKQCLNDIENNLYPEKLFSIYTKGHLKLFCEAVDVPVENIMSSLKKDGFEYIGTKIIKQQSKTTNTTSIKNLTNNISTTQIAILMVIVGWIVFINNPSKTEKKTIEPTQNSIISTATDNKQQVAIKTDVNKNSENDIER